MKTQTDTKPKQGLFKDKGLLGLAGRVLTQTAYILISPMTALNDDNVNAIWGEPTKKDKMK